jgi:hypothetical protein
MARKERKRECDSTALLVSMKRISLKPGGRLIALAGMYEVESGMVCVDGFRLRGRKHSEDHLPNLLKDITIIVDVQSQADPQFRTTQLYTSMTAAEVRRELIAKKGYSQEELPTSETIATKLNILGSFPKKVAEGQPQKSS